MVYFKLFIENGLLKMPDLTSGNKVMVFGDFFYYYSIHGTMKLV